MSLLPDTREVPSDEKVIQVTSCVCPERTAVWVPVIALRMRMSPGFDPIAMALLWYDRVYVSLSRKTVQEHIPVRERGAGVTIQSDLEGILNLKAFSCR